MPDLKLGDQVFWVEREVQSEQLGFGMWTEYHGIIFRIRFGHLKSVYNGSALVSYGFWNKEEVVTFDNLFATREAAERLLVTAHTKESANVSS